jgi:hypothetical protein
MRSRVLSVFVCLTLCGAAQAQSTAFTYQGRLKNGSQLATGLHDFRFRLFSTASGGSQVGDTQCADNVLVTEGLFATTVDFGQQFASPNQRFLEIEVRVDSGLDCADTTGYSLLSVRQPLTAAPLASHAKAAFALDAPDGSPVNAVFVDNLGKVGIGTTGPTHNVHVAAIGPTLALQDLNPASQQAGYVSYRDNGNIERAWVGFGTPGDPDFSIVNARNNGDIVLSPLSGNVGIGTPSPSTKLEVHGEVRYGSTGQYRPAACEEPLRVIRGKVSAAGALTAGFGFTVAHPSTGVYTITYTSPFTGTPVVTANANGPTSLVPCFVIVPSSSTSSVELIVNDFTNVVRDRSFDFIAIGPR